MIKKLMQIYRTWGLRQSYRHNCRVFGEIKEEPDEDVVSVPPERSRAWGADLTATRKALHQAEVQYRLLIGALILTILLTLIFK